MCGRYNFDNENEDMFAITKALQGMEYKTGEICPTNPAPVLAASGGSVAAGVMIWGFLNFRSKSGVLINARAETAQEKKTFQNAVMTRRCVIPSTGFFEWKQDETKQKYLFTMPQSGALYMAGLYGEYDGVKKYVILTTTPNASVADIHNRMPLVLEKSQINDWIFDNDHALTLLHGTPPMLERAMAE